MELKEEDAPYLFELNNYEEVKRNAADPGFSSLEEAKDFIANYSHYRLHGFGRWAVFRKDTGDFIGCCGLRKDEEPADVYMGFRLMRNQRGFGFATEAAIASLDFGFQKAGLKRVIAYALPTNTASLKILQKAGMSYERTSPWGGQDWLIYAIHA